MYFILGEKKEVKIKITSINNDPFTIRNPVYKLINENDEIETNGTCEVNESEVGVLIQPKEIGSYTLDFTYEIANEVLKSKVSITVGEG